MRNEGFADPSSQFFFFAAINIISFILTLFFLPETKGVSLEQMVSQTSPSQKMITVC